MWFRVEVFWEDSGVLRVARPGVAWYLVPRYQGGQSKVRFWWDGGGLESSMTPGETPLGRATQKPNIGTRSFLQAT